MIDVIRYLNGFREELKSDDSFRQCFEKYLGDARTIHGDDVERTIVRFQQAERVQFGYKEKLCGEYANAFQALTGLAMRLALLAEAEDERKQERKNLSIQALLRICRAHDWVTQGKTENRFRADLWTGTLCAEVSVLYAMLQQNLTAEQAAQIRKAIIFKGIRPVLGEWLDPLKHWHTLDSMGHNWFLVIICGAGVASLALMQEEPEYCRAALDRIVNAIAQWFRYPGNDMQYKKANFGQDGDYIEYLGYMIYGFSTYFLLEFFYRDQTGMDTLFEKAYFLPQPQILLDFCRETWAGPRMANFGDASAIWSKHQHVYYCMAVRLGCGELMMQQKRMTAGPNSWEDFLFYPLAVKVPNQGRLKPNRMAVYPHTGIASVRTGKVESERFFAIRAGESWNHNHLDAGTFILTDRGWNIAVDSGTCDYGFKEYRTYYTASKAHNTLMLNNRGQDEDMFLSGSHQDGKFTSWLNAEDAGVQYLRADCTGPYSGVFTRFFRHAVLLSDWTILIDDVQAVVPGELSWLLHYEGKLRMDAGHVLLENGNLCAALYPLWPQGQKMSVEKSYLSADRLSMEGQKHPLEFPNGLPEGRCLYLNAEMKTRRAKLITAISRAKEDPFVYTPVCRPFQGGEEIIFPSGRGRERLIVNHGADGSIMHKNSWLRYEGIYTDAFLVYLREDANENLLAAAVCNGSLLEVGASFAFGSLVKMDITFDSVQKRFWVCAPMNTEITWRIEGDEYTEQLVQGHSTRTWRTKEGKYENRTDCTMA